MCFSVAASFTAGTFLIGFGVMTLSLARRRKEVPFAAIPLLFGLQQLSEGVVWISFGAGWEPINFWATQFFSFFSHVLWPVWVPVATLAIEPSIPRRRLLFPTLLAGVFVSLFLLYSMFLYPIRALAADGHIEYVSPHFYLIASVMGYVTATTVSLLFSSRRAVQSFGLLVALSLMLAYWIYAKWFISVWCFFAAIMSIMVFFGFLGRPKREMKSL